MNVNRKNIKYAACNSAMHDIFEINSSFNFSKNRTIARPLSGGVSIGNYLNMYGTLGGLFRDNTDGTIVGLTCRHVCDQMICMSSDGQATGQFAVGYPPNYDFLKTRFTSLCDRLSKDFILLDTVLFSQDYPDNFNREYTDIFYYKIYKGTQYTLRTYNRTRFAQNANLTNNPIYQPGYPLFQPTTYKNFLTGFSLPSYNSQGINTSRPYPQTIGHVKRVVPLTTDLRFYNEVDSGVIAIEKPFNEDLMLDKGSCNFVGFKKTGGSVFATTNEINSLSTNAYIPLFKTGAGTGATGLGATDTSCHTLSFTRFYDFIGVEGVNYTNGIAFTMVDTSGDIRSNILSASNSFSNILYGGYFIKPNTLAQDNTDPFGIVNNAWSFKMSSATGGPSNNTAGLLVGNRYQNIIPDNTDVTVSLWVKADPGLNVTDIWFGLGDYSQVSIKSKISTQWQRFSYTGKYRSVAPFSSTGSRGFQFHVIKSGSTNLNHKIYIYGAQLELGKTMTNYVQTPDNISVQYNGSKRTNLITGSEDFTNTSYWSRQNISLQANQGLKNKIRNSIGTGAQTGVVGSGGSFPTLWFGSEQSFSGMGTEIVGTGVENNLNYVDVRLYGNTVPQAYMFHNLYTEGNVAAAFGQTWSHSMYYKVINAPSIDNINAIMLLNAMGGPTGYLGEINSATYLPTDVGTALTRYSISGTVTQSSTQYITPYLQFNFINPNEYVDITVRMAAPQLEWGENTTTYTPRSILTNPIITDLLSLSSADMSKFTADNITGTGGDSFIRQQISNLTPGITGTFSCWVSTPHILTNLLLRSEEINNTIWTKGSTTTVTSNVVPGPNSWFGNVADQVVATGSGFISQAITAKPSTNYTFSVWLRSANGSGQNVQLRLEDGGSTRSTRTVTLCANDWNRYSITGSSTSAPSQFRPSIRTGNYYVWGAQLEEGSRVSNYVSTIDTKIERITLPLVLKYSDITTGELASQYFPLTSTLTRYSLSAVVPEDGIINAVIGDYGVLQNNQTIQVWGAQFEEGNRPTNYIQTYDSPTTVYTTETIPLSTLEGDSGSMLWALLSSNSPTASAWKIVGQVFAYSNDPLPVIGYASRMDKIQQALDISPWDGTNISYTPKTPTYFTAFSTDEVVSKMGRRCYRVSNGSSVSASYVIS